MKNTIMEENLKRFKLTYNSLLFSREILLFFRNCRENKPIYDMIHNETLLKIEDNKIGLFYQILYQ